MLLLCGRVGGAGRAKPGGSGGAFHAPGDRIPAGRPLLRPLPRLRHFPPSRKVEEPPQAGPARLRAALRPGPAGSGERPFAACQHPARPGAHRADRRDRPADHRSPPRLLLGAQTLFPPRRLLLPSPTPPRTGGPPIKHLLACNLEIPKVSKSVSVSSSYILCLSVWTAPAASA